MFTSRYTEVATHLARDATTARHQYQPTRAYQED